MKEAIRAWANYHPYTISRLWLAAVRSARRYSGHPRFVSIRYEDLVFKPEETVHSLCAAVGLDYQQAMLAVPQVGSSSGKDRPDQLGIDPSRAGSWRKGGLTDTELAICEHVCGAEMRLEGYECENITVAFWRWWLSMTLFVFKATLALALNLGRTRNLMDTLRRRIGR